MPRLLRRVSSNSDLRNAAGQQQQITLNSLETSVPSAGELVPTQLFTIPNYTFANLEAFQQEAPELDVSSVSDSVEPFPDFEEDVADLIDPAVQVHFRDFDWDYRVDSPTSPLSLVSPRAQGFGNELWDDGLREDLCDRQKQYNGYSDYLNGVQRSRRPAITKLPFPARLRAERGTAYDSQESSIDLIQSPRDSVPPPLLGRMQRCPYDLRKQRVVVEMSRMRRLRKGCSRMRRAVREWFGVYEATEMV